MKLWYNIDICVVGGFIMSQDEKFEFDIANLKKDLAMENMIVEQEDIDLLRRYSNKEITMNEMIDIIKRDLVQGV